MTGKLLAELLEEAGVPIGAVARGAGTSLSNVSHQLAGRRKLQLEVLRAAADLIQARGRRRLDCLTAALAALEEARA